MNHKDQVILHMIGQVMDGGAGRPIVTTRDVSKWLKCTVQNANQKLLQLIDNGLVQRTENYHRSNAVKYCYELTPDTYAAYRQGAFKLHYAAFVCADMRPV